MKHWAITGGIAAGKSEICKVYNAMSIPVYNADLKAKFLIDKHDKIINGLVENFGDNIYQDGKLNKQKMIQLVFNNEDTKSIVDSIVHPVVLDDYLNWRNNFKNCRFTLLESALVFESGLIKHIDVVGLVTADISKRVQRLLQRDGITSNQALQRINSQVNYDKYLDIADFIIINNGTEMLIPQVLNAIKSFYNG
ncbi:MAG TPA: dephospho-CoA kinase [Bacteroidales bacterium]|jgi:dephospho-CoA kinase|nr:dephospho-CoA kinase [Bacteroidales bacterium]MDD4236378.1 dephospho-CoA kinase [Bacteroidales bacterium]HXK82407.1 dephospho-CoA kinase [Bacteroidales bacterium]